MMNLYDIQTVKDPINKTNISLQLIPMLQQGSMSDIHTIFFKQISKLKMENSQMQPYFKKSSSNVAPFQPMDNISKKRPSTTKLDLEKMYEDSLQFGARYKKLMKQNKELKKEYQRVETIKNNRQNLISTVQKIVAQKSKELKNKSKHKFSWLVHNLAAKISELKDKIEGKEKAIEEISMSKQSLIIKKKQEEIDQLNGVIKKAKMEGKYREGMIKDPVVLAEIKEIVWMQQEVKEKQGQILEAEEAYRLEEEEVKSMMKQLSAKRAQLKYIKELQNEYNRTQQIYKEQKRKKEQRIAGNKTYLEELQNQKVEEINKLEQLKQKFALIQEEENVAIRDMKAKLQKLRIENEEKIKVRQETIIKCSEKKIVINNKKEVKRVSHEQVKGIANNLSYILALKGVHHQTIGSYFEKNVKYSIQEVAGILKCQPFSIQNQKEALLMARYVVEDSGDGYFLEDMDTAESSSIIRSILGKLIGQVRIFTKEQSQKIRHNIGPVLFKFGKLVQQSLDMKQGHGMRDTPKSSFVTKEAMVDALQNSLSSLQSETFLHEEIDFTLFYLFSWSRKLDRLEVKKLFSMVQDGVNWPSLE